MAFGGTLHVPLNLVVLLTLLSVGAAIRVPGLPVMASSSPAPSLPRLDGRLFFHPPLQLFPLLLCVWQILLWLLRAFVAAL